MKQDLDASRAVECRDCRYRPVTQAGGFRGEAVRKRPAPGAVDPS